MNCREGELLAENYSVEIFPMPIQSGATFVVRGDVNYSEVSFQLFDLTGKLIHQFGADGITTHFDKGSLMSGMYLLKTIYVDQPIGINKVLLMIPISAAVIAIIRTAPAAKSFIFPADGCCCGEIKLTISSMAVLIASTVCTIPIARTSKTHCFIDTCNQHPIPTTNTVAKRCMRTFPLEVI